MFRMENRSGYNDEGATSSSGGFAHTFGAGSGAFNSSSSSGIPIGVSGNFGMQLGKKLNYQDDVPNGSSSVEGPRLMGFGFGGVTRDVGYIDGNLNSPQSNNSRNDDIDPAFLALFENKEPGTLTTASNLKLTTTSAPSAAPVTPFANLNFGAGDLTSFYSRPPNPITNIISSSGFHGEYLDDDPPNSSATTTITASTTVTTTTKPTISRVSDTSDYLSPLSSITSPTASPHTSPASSNSAIPLSASATLNSSATLPYKNSNPVNVNPKNGYRSNRFGIGRYPHGNGDGSGIGGGYEDEDDDDGEDDDDDECETGDTTVEDYDDTDDLDDDDDDDDFDERDEDEEEEEDPAEVFPGNL